jgi:hypothetical protein
MDFLDRQDDELLKQMGKAAPNSVLYQQCRDVLQFRITKRLVEETQKLVKQTKRVAIWTICIAIGTGILAVATWVLVWISKR